MVTFYLDYGVLIDTDNRLVAGFLEPISYGVYIRIDKSHLWWPTKSDLHDLAMYPPNIEVDECDSGTIVFLSQ